MLEVGKPSFKSLKKESIFRVQTICTKGKKGVNKNIITKQQAKGKKGKTPKVKPKFSTLITELR